jgi:hypothetical protein
MPNHLQRSAEQQALRFAARNHGVITRRQALAFGLTARQVDRRLSTSRWQRAATGVYTIEGSTPTWRRDLLVACLAGGVGSAASHLSAAALHRLAPVPRSPQVTTAVARRHVGIPAIVHRSPLGVVDVVWIDRIPTTRPARTIVDCAMVCSPATLANVIDDALTRKMCTPREVGAALRWVEARPGRKGSGHLRRLLDVWEGAITPDSPAEARLIRRIVEWGLPAPTLQHRVTDHKGRFIARVDLAWPKFRVAVEYDGQRYHGPRHWDGDEGRHRALVAIGWEVHHVEKGDLTDGAVTLRRQLVNRLS